MNKRNRSEQVSLGTASVLITHSNVQVARTKSITAECRSAFSAKSCSKILTTGFSPYARADKVSNLSFNEFVRESSPRCRRDIARESRPSRWPFVRFAGRRWWPVRLDEIFIPAGWEAIYRNYRPTRTTRGQLFLRLLAAASWIFPGRNFAGPDVSKCPHDLCFTQYLLGSARAHRVLLLRRLAFLVGVLLLKLPSIVRWGGAGRLLLQDDEACALYNATAQPRSQGPKEIRGNIRSRLSFSPSPSFPPSLSVPRTLVTFLRIFPLALLVRPTFGDWIDSRENERCPTRSVCGIVRGVLVN